MKPDDLDRQLNDEMAEENLTILRELYEARLQQEANEASRDEILYKDGMTLSDLKRLIHWHMNRLTTGEHHDEWFIYPGILKPDGSKAFDKARIAKCNQYHNNLRKKKI